jgi:Holliday junction resolvasome RuvABC endonuclease subunit
MVRVILGMQGKMSLDESDALAIALCHAHSNATRRQIEAAQ